VMKELRVIRDLLDPRVLRDLMEKTVTQQQRVQ